MPSNLRYVTVKLQYDQKDITQDLVPYLKDFSFNDVMSGEADDISITLHDIEELWMSDWFPEKGAKLTASIVFHNAASLKLMKLLVRIHHMKSLLGRLVFQMNPS